MNSTFTNEPLKHGLDFSATVSLVVGTVIGTGVFLKPAVMTQEVNSVLWVFLAWIAAGFLSLAGALCYAELGSRFPQAGGEYVYLREAFGELPAFLNGWMRFCIGNPGSIAAYAVGLVTFLNGATHFSVLTQTVLAVLIIAVFTLINCATVHVAGRLQTYMAAFKIFLILILTFAIFIFRGHGSDVAISHLTGGWPGWKAFGAAMLAALWAYDGWNGMPMAGGEIRNAKRNIPLALIGGMLIVMLIYLAANFAFFVALPLREAASSYSPDFPLALPVATNAALATIGPSAVVGVSIVLAFSALVSLNGSILTGARVPFAMARDGVLFSALGRVHHKTRTPVISVLVQGVIAIVIACSGTFDQLTDYVMFASWVFYALAVLSLFVLRKRHPTSTNFVAPGYPWIPLAFLAVTAWLIANTLLTAPMESLIGLGLIALGIPVFLYFRKHSTRVEVIGK